MGAKSPLDDPHFAAFAWARYRRLMRWMMLVTLTMVVGALVMLYRENGLVSIHLYIAAALGISFTMLLMSALMGLLFLSHGTGHDDAIGDGNPSDWNGAAKAEPETKRPPDEA
ncbi:MAG: hypothetical protein JWQ16_474 [Novosphingobium sp.]|nr:hypothetical protein [Novosphingobium sp.]